MMIEVGRSSSTATAPMGPALSSRASSGPGSTRVKTQPPRAPGGRYPKTEFVIDLDAGAVTCPAGHTVTAKPLKSGQIARFGALCRLPARDECTTSRSGRTIHLGEHERHLAAARTRQRDPDWKPNYAQTRPTVERKIAHLMRRAHGGRRARVRGKPKVTADFQLLAAAINLARLGMLGLIRQPGRSALNPS